MSSKWLTPALAGLPFALSAVVVAVPAHAVAPPRVTTTSSTGNGLAFGTPVVVDNYRPGYEPDLAVDLSKSGSAYAKAHSTYVSMPNGFSTTQSYVWRSDDDRQTFHLAEGNLAGKTTTCVGGGDTELQVDPVNGSVYFADLQGLTNFSNSASTDGGHTWNTTCTAVNGAGVDRQWEAIDSNGGVSAVGPASTDGRIYFDYDNIERSGSGGVGGNQLVMNESVDGVHFGAACAGAAAAGAIVSACPEPPAIISANESIPGNVLVDNVVKSPFQHRVYAVHTGDGGASVVMSYCDGAPSDDNAAAVAADCTDPTLAPNAVNPYWHDSYVRAKGAYKTGNLFPSIALDGKGYLYAVWAETQTTGPAAIKLATSTDGGATWSAPTVVSTPDLQDTVMPWVVAGSQGRIGISWYGTTDGLDPSTKKWGPDYADTAQWNLFYAQSLNADSATPTFAQTQVNEPGHPIKFGNISTGGLGGAEDRSLGDFFQVQRGPQGQATITYVDDTSADRNPDVSGGTGQTPPEAAGPVMVATQNGGDSLLAGVTIPTAGTHVGSVVQTPAVAAADAFYSSAGQDVPAATNQQVGGVSVTQADATHLRISLTTEDPNLASDLQVSPTLGGGVGDWLVRWAAPSYQAPGDGNIFYVGMESVAGGAPTFYSGSTVPLTTTHAKYFQYPQTTTIPGTINGATITWTVPLTAIGSPAAGQGLYSVTGFTSTQLTPSPTTTTTLPNGSATDANIPNLIGIAPPLDAIVGQAASSPLPEVGLPLLLLGVGLAASTAMLLRQRRRAASPR